MNGEPIEGIFYKNELIDVKQPESYRIEIVGKRIRKGIVEFLVKYINYPTSKPEWKKRHELIAVD